MSGEWGGGVTSVDVAAIRARCEKADLASEQRARGFPHYSDDIVACAADVPALLSALGVAEARAQEAEATLERVKALHVESPRIDLHWRTGEPTGLLFCICGNPWPCPTIAALHGVPSQPQGDPT